MLLPVPHLVAGEPGISEAVNVVAISEAVNVVAISVVTISVVTISVVVNAVPISPEGANLQPNYFRHKI